MKGEKKITNKNARRDVFSLARHYGVKVRLIRLKNYDGSVSMRSRVIYLREDLDSAMLLSTFFHELGHLHCRERGLFPAFHSPYVRSWRQVYAVRRTALRAELWVEKWAEEEYNKHVRGRPYVRSYEDEQARSWLVDYNRTITPGTPRR